MSVLILQYLNMSLLKKGSHEGIQKEISSPGANLIAASFSTVVRSFHDLYSSLNLVIQEHHVHVANPNIAATHFFYYMYFKSLSL